MIKKKHLKKISSGQPRRTALLSTVFVEDFFGKRHIWGSLGRAKQREHLWDSAEAWRGKHRSGDRFLSFICFTSSRCPRRQATKPNNLLRVYVFFLRVCVFICARALSVQGLGMQRWLNPWLSEKHARLPVPMTPNTHMAVLGKNKWAENEKHKHSWYWAGGGEETLHSLRLTIPLSQRQKRLFIDFLLCLLLCIWLPQCDHTCRPSRNWSRWGCWVYRCCCKGQSGSLVNQAIRQNHCSEEDVLVCGPNAWSSKKSSQKWVLECAINNKKKYLR